MWNPFEQPELVPIPREPSTSESGSVHINLPIPEFTGINLGMYLQRLEAWCILAGIRELKIGVSREQNDDTPQIAGVDSHGQGVAELTLSGSKNFSDSDQDSRKRFSLKMHRAVVVEINLRIQKILKEVSQTSEKGIRDAKALAKKIDHEIRKAFLKEGLKFLLTNFSKPDLFMIALRLGGIVIFGPGWDITFNIPSLNLLGYLNQKLDSREYRVSLFASSGPELDRALVFAICILTQTLIEPIIEEAETEE